MKAELRRIACLDVPPETLSDTDDLYAVGLPLWGGSSDARHLRCTGHKSAGEMITFDLLKCVDSLEGGGQLVHFGRSKAASARVAGILDSSYQYRGGS